MSLTLQKLKELLVSPHEIIARKAKTKDKNETIVMLTINWILIAIGVALFSQNYSLAPAILVLGIVGTLIAAFYIYLAFTVMGGKGDYTSVLISLTYPFFGVAFSTLVISLIYIWLETASFFIGAILFTLYFTVGLTGMFRVLKENFKMELVTVWIVISLLLLAIFISFYKLAIIYALKTVSISEVITYLISQTV